MTQGQRFPPGRARTAAWPVQWVPGRSIPVPLSDPARSASDRRDPWPDIAATADRAMPAPSEATEGAGRSMMAAITLAAEGPSNARLPVSISYSSTPNEKMSLLASTSSWPGCACNCSGDIYCSVPTISCLPVIAIVSVLSPGGSETDSVEPNFARPKSSNLMPDLVTRIFAGFRSRWMMPFLCAASSASQICAAILQSLGERQGAR